MPMTLRRFLQVSGILTMGVNMLKLPTSMFMVLMLISCNEATSKIIFRAKSPDGKFIAQLVAREERTFGSTRYQLELGEFGNSKFVTVFRGDDGDVASPVWDGATSIIVPFCFGSISSVESVTQFTSGVPIAFRGRTSSQIRIHVVTSPNTQISGRMYCTK